MKSIISVSRFFFFFFFCIDVQLFQQCVLKKLSLLHFAAFGSVISLMFLWSIFLSSWFHFSISYSCTHLPGGSVVKKYICLPMQETQKKGVQSPGYPLEEERQPTPVPLLGWSHWQRSLMGKVHGVEESYMTEWLSTHMCTHILVTRAHTLEYCSFTVKFEVR